MVDRVEEVVDASTPAGLPVPVAAAVAASAFIVPFALSRSTSPSPDHPWIFTWYRLLRKPAFQPPDIAIPLSWLAIETGLAWSGFRLLRRPASPARSRSILLLAANLVGIGGWNRLFFGSRNLPVSTVAAAVLITSSAAYVNEVRKVDRPAALAAAPLVGWVVFATILTAAIWKRNR